MAGKEPRAVEVVTFDNDGNDTSIQSENDFLESLLGKTDKTSEIILYRQKTKNHTDGMIRVESWSADICTPAVLMKAAHDDQKAAGLRREDVYYRVNIRGPNGLIPGGNRTFALAAKLDEEYLPAKGQSQETALLAEMMRQQREEMREFRQMMRDALSRPPADPFQEMQKTFGMIAAMREAFGMNNQPQQTQPQNPMEMVTSVVSLITGITDAKVKLAGALGGNDAEPVDPWAGAIREFAGPLLTTIQREQDLRARALDYQRPPIVSPDGAGAPPPPETKLSTVPQFVVDFLNKLQKRAENDDETDEVAKEILADSQIVSLLRHISSMEKPYRKIIDIVPEAIDYPLWWGDLIALIQEAFDDDGSSSQDSATAGHGGTAADTPDNGGGNTAGSS